MGAAVVALAVACVLTAWLASSYSPLKVLDEPNARSLHARPTSRTGGLAIVAGIASGWAVAHAQGGAPLWLVGIAMPAALVAVVSFLDDRLDLSPAVRFPV
ncbi:hypothetical protein D6833_03520, partial [Candidatus Parcubacteria bacterium]